MIRDPKLDLLTEVCVSLGLLSILILAGVWIYKHFIGPVLEMP